MLAWRLLHEPAFAHPPLWLRPLLPAAPAFDRDPVALALASLATLLALSYLGASLAGASLKLRALVIGAGSMLLVAVPTLAFVALGAVTERPYGQDGGVVQLPLALDKILRLESPYGADYSGTVLGRQARASSFWAPLGGNPILRHHAYLPGTHLVMLPAYLVSRAGLGFFDPRFVTLLFYAGAILLASFLPSRPEARLAAAGVVAFNPLTFWPQVFGANDVVFVAMILGAVLLVRGGRTVAAAVLLGLACATKQLAWPFAPFVLASLASAGASAGGGSLRGLLRPPALRRWGLGALLAGVTFVVVVAPLASLDPAAFYADIVQYNVGLPGDNYPLGGTPGFGFANFLISYGAVTSLSDYFPFGRFYLLFVPLGLLLLARQLKAGRPEAALVLGSAALFASIYFSRVVHPNYLVPAAILLPIGLLALGWPADLGLTPLALGALAVTYSEQEVFRSAWDQAVAARVPETLPALVRAVLPHPAAGLTNDPLGLVLSALAAALALVVLVAGVAGARPAVRAALGSAALVAVVVVPAWLVVTIGWRTGTPRGLDSWVAQVPADALRLVRLESPYAPPPAERPVAREAWATSFRMDPPAELRPDRPLVPPGGPVLAAGARLFGLRDPRGLSGLALALFLWAMARRAPALAPGLGLVLPAALGLVFGTGALWVAGGLALVAVLAERGRGRAAALVLGATVAVDLRALAGAPLLARGGESPGAKRLGLAAVGAAALVLPVILRDPVAFAAAVTRPLEAAPGFGLANLLLYGGGPPAGSAFLLKVASLSVAALGCLGLGRVSSDREAWASAAFLSLALLWLDPSPPAGALALPLLLLAAAAVPRPRWT